ncbi:hypothetical protein QYH69_11255 [Paraburkholderia sp. SARCC-3016]|uniref:hypothetical protein n=1 Tax=Paraburkholderia sp. SARCC-3016 TaxID=3058611 RepID=UPI00280677D5|nr:hypothetical protein [Paraburkholderia sp. SARCC-3016]MDQ7977818.1 hypothetical protein [Paraburkholderia sp. SARCC-3016]
MSIIQDRPTFDRLRQMCSSIANWRSHDPDKYGQNIEYCDWMEFKVANFLDFVNALSHANGDAEYYFVDVCAMSRDDLVLTAGDFPAIRFDCQISERDYFHELDRKVNFIKDMDYYTMFYTNEYAFFPLSMNWHIYGLYDIELARIQSRAPFPATPFPHDYIPADEAHRLIRLLD